MRKQSIILLVLVIAFRSVEVIYAWPTAETVIDERNSKPFVQEVLPIDKVWAGHPVGFFLMTCPPRQYVAYYNSDRKMMVGMRLLEETTWKLYHPVSKTDGSARYLKNESSTILGWDSHNYITMKLDSKGYVHLSGNMHCNALTYFRSEKPYDITTLKQVEAMVGRDEDMTTYPKFKIGPGGELIFHYRFGKSGSGNEIYNVYDVEKQTWSRLLDKSLTDGQGKMNAYILGPLRGPDNWYHISWLWRDTPDCATNHDLSYLKSKDLITWQTAAGDNVELPITIDTKGAIVDPIGVNGGIINGSGQIGFDSRRRVVLSYHKFDNDGKTQAYTARFEDGKWVIRQLSNWDYRWEFSGGGSISNKVRLSAISARQDGLLELDYSNFKHGKGTWLIDSEKLKVCGKVLKSRKLPEELIKPVNTFEGMEVHFGRDSGEKRDRNFYVLRWETLGRNRDLPRTGALPEPSELKLYKISLR